MTTGKRPNSWSDPEYVSGIVGVIATGTLFLYSALIDSAPSVETIGFIVLWIFLPMGLAYEIAQRRG